MERTLVALALQQLELCDQFGESAPILYVHVVADGAEKLSASMVEYFEEQFGYDPAVFSQEGAAGAAHVLQVPTDVRGEVGPVLFSVRSAQPSFAANPVPRSQWSRLDRLEWTLPLHVVVQVKRDNGKKHHSHEWFFHGCVANVGAELAFCTDVGTLYSSRLLVELVRHMAEHPKCAACCGHQRVMRYLHQTPPEELVRQREEGWVGWALRACQSFDFTSGQAIFKGSHALTRFLSVLPGPCGLYRCAYIAYRDPGQHNSCLDKYFELVKRPARSLGVVTANLRIAEDRIISYGAVLWAARPRAGAGGGWVRDCVTDYVPTASFFFESEAPLDELVKQRRRWLNGTVAGYAWLAYEVLASMPQRDHGLLFNLAAVVNLLSQILTFFMLSFTPALTLIAFVASLSGLDLVVSIWAGHLQETSVATISSLPLEIICAVVYFAAFAFHVLSATTQPYAALAWRIQIVLNAIVISVTMLAFWLLALTALFSPERTCAAINFSLQQSVTKCAVIPPDSNPCLWFRAGALFGVLYISFPFFLALLTSGPAELWRMLPPSASAYYLFLPTMNSSFFTYALSRVHDVSWGNKGSGAVEMDRTSLAFDNNNAGGDLAGAAGGGGAGDGLDESLLGGARDDDAATVMTRPTVATKLLRQETSFVFSTTTGPTGAAAPAPAPIGVTSVIDDIPGNQRGAGAHGAIRPLHESGSMGAEALWEAEAAEKFRSARTALATFLILGNLLLVIFLFIAKTPPICRVAETKGGKIAAKLYEPKALLYAGAIAASPALWPMSRSFLYAVLLRLKPFYSTPIQDHQVAASFKEG